MKKEDVSYIRQIVLSMRKLIPKIEEAHRNNDVQKFNEYKKMFLRFGEEIQNKSNGLQ